MRDPAVPVMAMSVAGRFAEGVCPVLVIGRDAPVGVDGDAMAAAPPPGPTPELPETADCIVRGIKNPKDYRSGLETVLR